VKEQLVYIGVDIAKSHLDAAMGNEKRRFSNDTIGHRELIKWVKQVKAPVQVICESSGGYERALVQALARAGAQISLVQANRVRQFARAAGILAKTDRIDAEGTVRVWQGDAAADSHRRDIGARTSARVGEPTQALNSLAGDGTESRCAGERCLGGEIESQFDQPNQKAD
jgi:transposase